MLNLPIQQAMPMVVRAVEEYLDRIAADVKEMETVTACWDRMRRAWARSDDPNAVELYARHHAASRDLLRDRQGRRARDEAQLRPALIDAKRALSAGASDAALHELWRRLCVAFDVGIERGDDPRGNAA